MSVSAPGRKITHRGNIRASTEALAPGRNASDVQQNAKYGAPGGIDPMFATRKNPKQERAEYEMLKLNGSVRPRAHDN